MSNYDNYDGQGGFNDDGGFSNDGSSQKQQLRTTLTPVTIKQITEATQPIPDGEFQINNVSLNLISFVGVVRNVQDLTSAILITIEDGTGSIEVRKWIDESHEGEQNDFQKHEINKYVYVTGALKEFNGKKNLQHTVIRSVEDHNEILYHQLSAIYNHLKAQGLDARNGSKQKDDLFVKDESGMELPSSIQDKILAVIRENTNSMQEGVPVPFISQKLNLSDDVVFDNCSNLVDSGKIYSGYDDSAYLAV